MIPAANYEQNCQTTMQIQEVAPLSKTKDDSYLCVVFVVIGHNAEQHLHQSATQSASTLLASYRTRAHPVKHDVT